MRRYFYLIALAFIAAVAAVAWFHVPRSAYLGDSLDDFELRWAIMN